MNCCEELIIEGEPHWHLNAGCVVIIGGENIISFISSKGNEPVNTQSSAAYSQETYEKGQLGEKAHSCQLQIVVKPQWSQRTLYTGGTLAGNTQHTRIQNCTTIRNNNKQYQPICHANFAFI